jgi:polysaccharide biosynthesis/export protein
MVPPHGARVVGPRPRLAREGKIMTDTHPPKMRRVPALLALAAAAAAALACRGHAPSVPVEQYAQQAPDAEYKIAPGDVIAIRVWNQESMSNPHARVRDDGRISIPFLQDVDVAGITPSELSKQLQVKLKTYVVNPVVTVTVEDLRALRVSVLGEVAHPGQYELERGAGVLNALAAAGGLTDYAHHDAVYVVRNAPEAKAPVRIQFRYEALTGGEGKAAAFRLRPGDVVVVE